MSPRAGRKLDKELTVMGVGERESQEQEVKEAVTEVTGRKK